MSWKHPFHKWRDKHANPTLMDAWNAAVDACIEDIDCGGICWCEPGEETSCHHEILTGAAGELEYMKVVKED